MKTKIRKGVVLLIMGLLVCNVSFARTWIEFLTDKKGMWQLQNPNNMDESLIFSFVGETGFISTGRNLITNAKEQQTGTYEVSGTGENLTMKITVDGNVYSYSLAYENEDKFTLTGRGQLIFARSQSSEDTYLQRAVAAHKNPFSTGPDINLPTYNTGGKMACWSCTMTGRCGGCDGTGKVYGYGGSKVPCRLCGGSGICKFCSGTRYITY